MANGLTSSFIMANGLTSSLLHILIVLMYKLARFPKHTRNERKNVMPNDAPDVTGSVTYLDGTFRYIDWTGDKVASAVTGANATAVTPAELQALAVALGAASSASLYEVDVKDAFASNPDKDNADEAPRGEVANVLNILAKHPDKRSASLIIPAPIPDLFIAGSDEIDPASAELDAVFTAFLAVLPAGFEIISTRYSTRHQYNPATPI